MIELSVIIPTRNRAETLRATLHSIENQTLGQSLFEVIVCDNNSTDTTSVVSKTFENKFKNFQYIKTVELGLHVGRNKGFQMANGNVLVYADDDIEAFPEWLKTIYEVFQDKKVMLVGGKNLPKWEDTPPAWALDMWKPNKSGERINGWFSIIDLGENMKEIDPCLVWGCNFSVRKEIITATKGFNPDGMPQELIEFRGSGETAVSEYIKEQGYKAIYHPGASVYHLVSEKRLTLECLYQRGFNQGVSNSYAVLRNPTPKKLRRDFSFTIYVKKNIILFLKKVKFLFTKPEKTLKERNDIMAKGLRDGFAFHQKQIKKNPNLYNWVIKDNYL